MEDENLSSDMPDETDLALSDILSFPPVKGAQVLSEEDNDDEEQQQQQQDDDDDECEEQVNRNDERIEAVKPKRKVILSKLRKKKKGKKRRIRKKKNRKGKKKFTGKVEVVRQDGDLVEIRLFGSEVGMNLNWVRETSSLSILGFPDLKSSGKPSIVAQTGLLQLRAQLVAINGDSLQGLVHKQVIQRLKDAYSKASEPDGESPLLLFKNPPADVSVDSQPHEEEDIIKDNQQEEEEAESKDPAFIVDDDEEEEDDDSLQMAQQLYKPLSKTYSEKRLERMDSGSRRNGISLSFESILAEEIEESFRIRDGFILNPSRKVRVISRSFDQDEQMATSVTVQNISLLKANRFYLGPKNLNWQEVTKNRMSSYWEARILKLDISVEEASKKQFTKAVHFVGAYPSEKKALIEADKAITKRDMGLLKPVPRPNAELCGSLVGYEDGLLLTHLRISIESASFRGLSWDERLQLAYYMTIRCNVLRRYRMANRFSKVRGISCLGLNTLNLPLFVQFPVVFEFTCTVPEQYQSPRERMVPLDIVEKVDHAQDAVKHRITSPVLSQKQVREMIDDGNNVIQLSPTSPRKVLGIEDDPKQGGIYAHFYKDLTAEGKTLVQQNAMDVEAQVSKKPKQKTSSKSFEAFDLASSNTNGTQKEGLDMSLWRITRKYTAAAKVLQRAFRAKWHSRNVRLNFLLERSVLLMQVTIRKWLGSVRVQKWRILANFKALVIQRNWRKYLAIKRVRKIKTLIYWALLKVQPLIKRYVARKLEEWRQRDSWAAIKIQKCVRGHVARCEHKRKMAKHFHENKIVPSVRLIQRMGRGMLGRRIAGAIRAERFHREVVIPSTIAVQALWRRKQARKVAARLRARQIAAGMVQKLLRGKIQRSRYEKLKAERDRHLKASKIAALVRGYICRNLYEYRKREYHHEFVEIPAATKIQSAWHGLQARRWFRVLIAQDAAVLVLQAAWRAVIAKRKARQALEDMALQYKTKLATRLQACFRGHRGRKIYRNLSLEQSTRRFRAVHYIQRFWRQHRKQQENLRRERETENELHYIDLEILQLDLDDLKQDIEDVRKEHNNKVLYLSKMRKMRKDLKKNRNEMERRLPEVEHELENLDPDDETLIPWKEAYETEIEMLTNMIAMSYEELESKKLQAEDIAQDVEDLKLEWEDLEIEMEVQQAEKLFLIEKHRQRQIELSIEAFEKDRARRIRKQKNRWQVKDVRRKVIKRNLQEQREKTMLYFQPKALDRVSSIAVQKRNYYKSRDEHRTISHEFQQKMENRDVYVSMGQKSEKIRETYDETIQNVKKVLQDFTYDMRRPKTDLRGDPRKMCQKCGFVAIACKCANDF